MFFRCPTSIKMYSSHPAHKKQLTAAATAVSKSNALIITCGAGMGVDSGLPDFRGKEGFWRAFPLLKGRNITLSDMSTPSWFETDPDFAWGFFGYRYNMYSTTKPHAGFNILKKWGEKLGDNYFVFTSNVDGHFQKAGFNPDQIVECHGSINHLQCINPDTSEHIWDMPPGTTFEIDGQIHALPPHPMGPPHADTNLARPNILMFSDWTWVETRTQAQHTRMERYIKDLTRDKTSKTVIIEIGSGQAVPTVRMQSERLACTIPNATFIRINPVKEDCCVSQGNVALQMGGLEALQAIDEIIEGEKNSDMLD